MMPAVGLRVWPMVALVMLIGCGREDEEDARPPITEKREAIIDFPDSLKPEDPSVAEFVERVIDTCVEGDYQAFRLCWSAREDPFPRGAFERGWRAVEKVQIARVEKFRRRKQGDIVYGVHAIVDLDDSVPKPHREVVLLIVNEADEWRLASPPEVLVERFLGRDVTTQPAGGIAEPPATQPSSDSAPTGAIDS